MMRPGRKRPSLVLDFGGAQLKVAVGARFGRGAFVQEIVSLAPTAEALSELVTERGWKGAPTRIVLQDGDLVWRHTTAPKLERRLLTSAVELEIRKFAPTELEECHWSYRTLPANGVLLDRVPVQVACARSEAIDALKELARAAGLVPADVIPLPEALRESVDPAHTKEAALALLDIGARGSRLVILHQGQPVLYRTLGVGGDEMTAELGSVAVPGQPAFRYEPEVAEALKRAHGVLTPGPTEADYDPSGPVLEDGLALAHLTAALQPLVDRLVSEVFSTLDFWRERAFDIPFGEVRLIGGGALMPGLPEALSRALGVPVRVAAPPMLAGLTETPAIPGAVAAGALVADHALTLADSRPPGRLEMTGRFLTTGRVAALLVLALGLGAGSGGWRLVTERAAARNIRTRLAGQEAQADLLRNAARVRQQVGRAAELQRQLTGGAPDWAGILAGLSRQVVSDARLTEMTVDVATSTDPLSPPQLRLSGVVTGSEPGPQVLSRLLTALHDVPGLGPAQLQQSAPNDDGDDTFEISSPLLTGGHE